MAPARLRMMPSPAMRSSGATASASGAAKARAHVGPRRDNGAAEALGDAPRQRARRSNGDLLAEDGAHRELEGIETAGQAQACGAGKIGEDGVDGRG